MYNFDSYNVLLAIAINISMLLMTDFVLQGHIFRLYNLFDYFLITFDVNRFIG